MSVRLIWAITARFITGDATAGFGEAKGLKTLQVLATGSVLGVPVPFVLLIVVALIMGVVLHRSVFGRNLYAVGRNEEAAQYSGVNTRRIVTGAYIISGLLASLSAILFAFFTNSIAPSTQGQSYELYGIAAAVLGGCSLRGGEGSIIGILIGAALLQVLQNLVNLLNIPSSLNFAVVGAVILLGVITDQLLKKKGKA
ncbi:MAG: ABC transporter permease [Janthinobacterium lividum]